MPTTASRAASATESWPDRGVHDEDGAPDLSKPLGQHRDLLPVPIILTESAIKGGRRLTLDAPLLVGPGKSRPCTGLDLARGPEDTVLYVQIGSAWH